MPHARHPKQYPVGAAHPKLQVTPGWKARVAEALRENSRNGRTPRNRAELARAIGADKAGLGKMLDTEQPTYKYVRQICEVLHIDEPTIANPAIEADELSRAVAHVRSLPTDQQRRILRILRAALDESP